jgi:methionyl-tRNA synthetase
MPWGVPVPGDSAHVMYVWFDALVDYISAIGWPDDVVAGTKDAGAFQKWWIETGGVVQYCGKDNLRQQAAMWQAMLMAAGLSSSRSIIVNGFVTGEGGIKMSKSLGNVINPLDVVKEYGTDALRYYVAREVSPFEDSPFTLEKFKEAYNANLANGIGNLTSRIMKMAETNSVVFDESISKEFSSSTEMDTLYKKQIKGFETYNIQQACDAVWDLISATDKIIQDSQPFKVIKTDKAAGEKIIKELIVRLEMIGTMLKPIMPATSGSILKCIKENKTPAAPLFMRK